jgi:hypothetical protein
VTAYRQSTPTPNASSGPVGSSRVYSIPVWLKPGTTSIKIKAANRTYAAGAGASATIDLSVYASDGSENPVGASFGDFTGQVIPGNGSFSTQTASIPVTRGPDGKVVIVYSFPDPTFAFVANVKLGKYKLGTTTVNPPPVSWDGNNLNPVFWWDVDSDDGGSRAFDVDGDSISVNYSASGGNFDGAAWNILAQRRNYAVHIQGVVTNGSLQNLSLSGTLPYLHDDRLSATGKTKILQLGTNDGAYNDLPTMQASLAQCIADAVAAGYSKIYAWTVPPVAGYPAFNTGARLTFNPWLLANFATLGLAGVYDAAAPKSQGGLAKDGDPLTMATEFDSGDGSHPNDVGQVQIADGWDALLGVPVTTGALSRVLATLKRLSPVWPSTEADTSVGKELGSIAVAIGMAKDAVDGLIDEFFPDTTTYLIDKWERSLKVASVPSDAIETRRARVVARLRKINGPRISQLEQMLAPVLALDPTDMLWVEQLRSFIEEGITNSTGVVSLPIPTAAPARTFELGKPWPGVVDDTGVSVYIAMSGIGTTVATLKSPVGTVWTIPVNAATGWYSTRSLFVGERAGGRWTLSIRDSSGPTLTEARLLVSNNIDSGQIANFFVLRDPSLAGTPDLIEAQRLFRSTALAHNRAFVVEKLAFTIGDPHSLMGRDPLGA